MTDSAATATPAPAPTGRSIGTALLGLVFILAGTFAILMPIASTFAATFVVGVSLAAVGLAQIAQAFSKSWGGFFLHILLGLLYLAAGLCFWLFPLAAALVITLTLAWVLLIQGIGEIVLAFRIRPASGWGWLLFAGLIALLAAIWLFVRIPIAGFFVPGMILGISLLFEGWAFLLIGRNPRWTATEPEPAPAQS